MSLRSSTVQPASMYIQGVFKYLITCQSLSLDDNKRKYMHNSLDGVGVGVGVGEGVTHWSSVFSVKSGKQ